MILLLDNFDSFTFNLYQMLQAQTEVPVRVVRNNAITLDEIKALSPAGIVISPGPGNPKDVGVCAEVLEHYEQLTCPILGVCLGQQLIAHAFGGQIIHAPAIMHGKTSAIQITQPSPLFEGMPDTLEVMRYHSLVVSGDRFPESLQITAQTADGIIMALQHNTLPIYGVQFHPESIGTPAGQSVLDNFITTCLRTAQAKSASLVS